MPTMQPYAVIETSTTATHRYVIQVAYDGENYMAQFQPLNPKTGKPWQATHRITHGADVQLNGWNVPIAFSTIALAQAAISWKKENVR